MSRTFIKEWVEKINEDCFITHRLRNNQEKTITSTRALARYSPYEQYPNIVKECYCYLITDSQGKNFTIYVDKHNEKMIYFKEIQSDISIIRTTYFYDEQNRLESKQIKTIIKGNGTSYDSETKYEVYKYQDINSDPHEYEKYIQDLKFIREFQMDNGSTLITEVIPSNKDYFKVIINSEYDYCLLYNNDIVRTKVYNEKIYREKNQLITETVEFTIDKFTYKIINYDNKNKLKLIMETNQEDELTLSERFFYVPENKNINFYQLFAAIALREKTLLGIKGDNPQKYFFILLRDLEELVKFNFIKEDKKEEEIKENEM